MENETTVAEVETPSTPDPNDMFDPLNPDMITVWYEGVARAVPREDVYLIDRSRHVMLCNRRRYNSYYRDGTGYSSGYWNPDTEFGSAIHSAYEALMAGQSFDFALTEFRTRFLVGRVPDDKLSPLTDEILKDDLLHLGHALIKAFEIYVLPDLLATYEVIEIEPQINWIMGLAHDNRPIVVMSAPDVILRGREDNLLYHASIKTTKRFDKDDLEALEIEPQKWLESFAIMHKYGEPVAGSQFIFAQKGLKDYDEELRVDRYTSGLIRPYINHNSAGSIIQSRDLGFQSRWKAFDEDKRKDVQKSLLPQKDWRRGSYEDLDYPTYLQWLQDGLIQPFGEAHFQTVVILPPIQEWNDTLANRWLYGALGHEIEWHGRVVGYHEMIAHEPSGDLGLMFDSTFRLNDKTYCYQYRQKCPLYDTCWHNKPLERLVHDKVLKPRVPHHPQERRTVDEHQKS